MRSTNVMGASKRLAELVIQDLSKSSKTVFTMVRFGNVLGSSGSVIPKFKSQINAGGPITVTHEEITRYFMSIPEAAYLVLHAGTLANGGDVFLLDMGDPVKIVELAKSMVRQHGLQPVLSFESVERKKRDNEILIKFTGLRPGEKLFEELLIDGVAQETPNPKIFKSHDGALAELDLGNSLQLLQESIESGDVQAVLTNLQNLPLSYQPNAGIAIKQSGHDNIHKVKKVISASTLEQNRSRNTVNEQEHPSLLQRVVSTRFGLAVLHRYFLLIRGMTLGVRVLVQNPEGEILLVQHTYLPGWHLPGGGVDHGEEAREAALREVYEECGINDLKDLRHLKILFNKNISKRDHVVIYSATTSEKLETLNNLEIRSAKFFSLEDLPADVDEMCITALDEINSFRKSHKRSHGQQYYFGDEG